ncbi:RpiR family transcriptional regulator [Bacillus bingmayongensis]|nr:RpiR family transcriptional regulator [Bacillus bingmayongensis]MBY0595703.1 RpiR family transcriptional regulator [Bacillus bingmayongensis]
MIVITIDIVNDSSPIGDCDWFTACIGIFFILQTLMDKQTRT